jgi:NitT/TauT family transport system substrate-binding protein
MHDVSLSPLNGSNALVALETGALQAADLYAPSSSQAISSGVAKLAVEVPAGAGAMVMGNILTSHPQVAEAIARALLRTQRTYLQGDYHSNPQVAADIAKILGVPASFVTSPANPSLIFNPSGTYPSTYLAPAQQYYLSLTPKILTYSQALSTSQLVDETPLTAALSSS